MRVVPYPEADEQIQAPGHHAHCLRLRQGADGLDDLAQVHAGTGRDRDVDDDRVAERRPVDVDPVAADDAAALQPGHPVSDRRGRHLDGAGQRTLRLARIFGERTQQSQVEAVYFHLRSGGRRDLGEPGERS